MCVYAHSSTHDTIKPQRGGVDGESKGNGEVSDKVESLLRMVKTTHLIKH